MNDVAEFSRSLFIHSLRRFI